MSWFIKENPEETKKVQPKASLSALLAASHPHLSPNTVEQTASPVAVEIPVEKEPEVLEVPAEIAVVEENLPAVQEIETIVPTQKEEIKLEAPELKKPVEQKDLNHVNGEEFLSTMLSEFSELLSAGKALAKMEDEKNKNAENGRELDVELKEKSKKRNELRNSLVDLLTEENTKPEHLEKSLSSYQEYLLEIESSYSAMLSETQRENNKFLIQIKAKKEGINELLRTVGGSAVFEKIKKTVVACKEIRQGYLNEQYKNNPKLKPELLEAINQDINLFVENDLHGAKMLAEAGNIVNIFIAMYNKSPQK